MIRLVLQNRGRAEEDTWLGILSSHPAAILATLRACGGGLETVNPDSNKAEGAGGDAKLSSQLCQACPIARELL
jgi:hypothetical protein